MPRPNDEPDLSGLPPIVLFDGVCNLCNAAVRFILDNDKKGTIRFASLQSDFARTLLGSRAADSSGDPETILFIEDGRVYDRSTAALRIARHLKGIWPVAGVYLVVPPAIRDAAYDLVAKRRYRLFGRSDVCRVPTAEEAAKFLDAELPAT